MTTAAATAPIRVLLVEDNPGDARLIFEMLRDVQAQAFDLERVDRLAPALERLGRAAVDVVLLDLGLPDSTGLSTFERASDRATGEPIIVISGLDDERVALEAVRSGAQDYLVKGRIEGNLLARVIHYAIERKRAEQQLRASEARLVAILEAALDAHVTMDQVGNVLSWNRQAEAMFGWSQEDVRGKRLADLIVPPQHREAHLAGLRRFLKTGEGPALNQRLELSALRRDGGEFPIELAIAPIRLGTAWVFSAFVRDITARKAADAALRASELHHRTVLEHIADAVFIVDAEGRYLDVNPRACDLTGYTRDELLRMSSPDTYPEEDRVEARSHLREIAAQTGRGSQFYERRLIRKDGTERAVEVNARPLPDGRLLATARDVTERKQLELQLRQAQKMEAIGRLAGGVAHDFNNVLTAIFGYVDLLREELPADSPAHQDLAEVRKASERAAALTRQLLAFSRQQVLEPIVLEPNGLIEDFEKMLHRVIGEDVKLRLALAQDVGNVRADSGQLQQVIMNLVVNARDAMPTGGSIILETANAELTEQYAELHQPVKPGGYVMLAVSDSGTGMTPEIKARIFEPFFTTKEKGKGTGLGLSTVYGIVKQSGGYIWAYSEVGRGTTFKIYLPRVDAPAEPLTRPKETGSLAGTETILLAEDDAILRPLARELLRKLGYTVLEGEDAESALAAARAHEGPIHLLVADVVMPGPSGRELARRLAAIRQQTKVLYISGYTDDAIVHHGMLEPGLHFLQKPFTPAVLARKVRDVLDAE